MPSTPACLPAPNTPWTARTMDTADIWCQSWLSDVCVELVPITIPSSSLFLLKNLFWIASPSSPGLSPSQSSLACFSLPLSSMKVLSLTTSYLLHPFLPLQSTPILCAQFPAHHPMPKAQPTRAAPDQCITSSSNSSSSPFRDPSDFSSCVKIIIILQHL